MQAREHKASSTLQPLPESQPLFAPSFIHEQIKQIKRLGKRLHPDAKDKDEILFVDPRRIKPIITHLQDLQISSNQPYVISGIQNKTHTYTGLIGKINRAIRRLDSTHTWPSRHELSPTLEQIKENMIRYIQREYPNAVENNSQQQGVAIAPKYLTSTSCMSRAFSRANSRLQESETCIQLKTTAATFWPPMRKYGTLFAVIGVAISGLTDGIAILAKRSHVDRDSCADYLLNHPADYGCLLGQSTGSTYPSLLKFTCSENDIFYSCPADINKTTVMKDADTYADAEVDEWTKEIAPEWTKLALTIGGGVSTFLGCCVGLFKAPPRVETVVAPEVSQHDSDIEHDIEAQGPAPSAPEEQPGASSKPLLR